VNLGCPPHATDADEMPACELAALRCATNLSTSAITYWDRQGICRYANRASLEWLCVHDELLVGSTFRDLAHSIGLSTHIAHAQAALHGDRHSVVQTFRHAHGLRTGLVQYLPDVRDGLAIGFAMQVSPTLHELGLDERMP
jgi:hypothetical protein